MISGRQKMFDKNITIYLQTNISIINDKCSSIDYGG